MIQQKSTKIFLPLGNCSSAASSSGASLGTFCCADVPDAIVAVSGEFVLWITRTPDKGFSLFLVKSWKLRTYLKQKLNSICCIKISFLRQNVHVGILYLFDDLFLHRN